MQHFLQGVNDSRLMFFLREEVLEDFTDFLIIDAGDWDVNIGGEDATCMETEYSLEWRLFIDPKGVEPIEFVECFSSDDASVGNGKLEFSWVSSNKEVADYSKENKRNCHEWAIGKDSVGNDEREENR